MRWNCSGPKGKAALVEIYDTGNNVTHWDNKAEAGRRFGLAALTEAYGQKHIYTGPRMVETSIAKNKATIRFTHVGDGLSYEPSIDGISGVYLSGKSGKPQWAEVKVIGKNTIEVSHPASPRSARSPSRTIRIHTRPSSTATACRPRRSWSIQHRGRTTPACRW